MVMFSLFGVELVCFFCILWSVRSAYKSFIQDHRKQLPAAFIAPVSLWIMEKLRLADRLSEPLARVHQCMAGLHGSKNALPFTRCFIVKNISFSLLCFAGGTLLAAVTEDNWEILLYTLFLTALIPYALYKELAGQLQKKKRQMLLELPEVMNQLILLVNAGETVQKALLRCVERGSEGLKASPLLHELAGAAYQIRMNASFPKAMEDFSKRCGMQEVSLFTTTLLLNYRRGGDELVMSMKELSTVLWEKRKSLARTLGEEASSKMVFPMVLIFLVVMVVVASPAVLMMGQ